MLMPRLEHHEYEKAQYQWNFDVFHHHDLWVADCGEQSRAFSAACRELLCGKRLHLALMPSEDVPAQEACDEPTNVRGDHPWLRVLVTGLTHQPRSSDDREQRARNDDQRGFRARCD